MAAINRLIGLPELGRSAVQHHCLLVVGDDSVRPLQFQNFHRDALGNLILTVELQGKPLEEATQDFLLDPATLGAFPGSETVIGKLSADPPSVQKRQLVPFTPLPGADVLKSHLSDLVNIKLIIGKDGSVEQVEVTNALLNNVFWEVGAAPSQWMFRPTLFKGARTKVVTGFETEPGKLADPEWPAKNN